jgi:PD-(D/E)XK nuclease superfamily
MPDFCPRCFWLGEHMDLPFERGFPGIFISIDSYTKAVVNESIRRGDGLPNWLAHIGQVKSVSEPTYRKFGVILEGVRLDGSPDALLQMDDASYIVLDYKTARFTPTQDKLMPVYRVQLNGYAMIAESLGMAPVSRLGLVYFEPPEPAQKDVFNATAKRLTTADGFSMPFTPRIHWVDKNFDQIRKLLRTAMSIYERNDPPAGEKGCQDCERLGKLVSFINSAGDVS